MMEKGKMERGVVEVVDTESLVPQEHLLRKVDRAVEFRKLYEIVEPLYSEEEGRTSIDPVVLFKIVLLQHLDGIPSLRGTLRRAQTDIAYRWFLGYTLNEELPHFSSHTYSHGVQRFGTFCPISSALRSGNGRSSIPVTQPRASRSSTGMLETWTARWSRVNASRISRLCPPSRSA